jgi:hypothetical protein
LRARIGGVRPGDTHQAHDASIGKLEPIALVRVDVDNDN